MIEVIIAIVACAVIAGFFFVNLGGLNNRDRYDK